MIRESAGGVPGAVTSGYGLGLEDFGERLLHRLGAEGQLTGQHLVPRGGWRGDIALLRGGW
jgi:hypothetical protein